ncbi:unnamed protein product [Pleuronectes platessa]|uniref:Uncharacterized protein n=1 Tax=Pleuronectes platessa TaxID=8262 RepID=A0A9N7YXH3_PLEPL|nr:unnamed protein product [Pleuronectes platessa]
MKGTAVTIGVIVSNGRIWLLRIRIGKKWKLLSPVLPPRRPNQSSLHRDSTVTAATKSPKFSSPLFERAS